MTSATVLIAEDHPVFRDAVVAAVRASEGLQLAAATSDGREALALIRSARPAVAVLDQTLPGLTGTEILRQVRSERLATRVLLLSADDSGTLVLDAVQSGAAGFVSKRATLTEIANAIRAVARGDTVIAADVQAGLADAMRAARDAAAPPLTDREHEVLQLMAEGLSAPEIAERLVIGASTVRTHIRNLFEKLEVRDRAQAVATAMRRGLVR
jgi:two-component system nitrate/nitrite response regulator NarL